MAGDVSRKNGKKGGRPPSRKTLIAQMLRERMARRAYEKADRIFTAWEDVALGHYREVKNPITGTVRVYFKPPNGLAIKDMMEQVWGKPKQPIEISDEPEPEYDVEALRRMGKYVEPNDPLYNEALTEALRIEQERPALDLSRFKIRRMEPGFGIRIEGTPEELSENDAEEQEES